MKRFNTMLSLLILTPLLSGASEPFSAQRLNTRDMLATINGLDSDAQPALDADKLDKLYDGKYSAASQEPVRGAAPGSQQGTTIKPSPVSKATQKTEPPMPSESKSIIAKEDYEPSRFLSDAYGMTIYLKDSDTPITFRKGTEAEARLNSLPDGSVAKIIFYGHGAPGMINIGPSYLVDPEKASSILKGKMSPGGTVDFSGCNTASISNESSLNPLIGLSTIVRRVMYFSVPYFADRFAGTSEEAARGTWEKNWNMDLARETSFSLSGSKVCGYRTYGLVPARTPVITNIIGTREDTTPGYVLGDKVCYINGKEVDSR